MINSMTAHGQASINTELGELSCELRSVNHRYLEITLRMPEEFRLHEGLIRDRINERLARGHLDCFIRLKENETTHLEPNVELAVNMEELLSQMQKHVPSMQAIRAIDVLRWPGLLQAKKADSEAIKTSLLSILNTALDNLIAARVQEGAKMAALIQARLSSIREVIIQVREFLPEISERYRARLDEKLGEIKDQIDPTRLEQEMVIFLQKTDVAEELDRLEGHVDEVENILEQPQPVGRRLDFLMQELNREANTLGSKAQDPRMTNASVNLKVFIEQMREQVQNIE